MKKRVVTAVVALAILLPVLWFSDKLPFVLLLCAAGLLSVVEGGRCFNVKLSDAALWPFYLLSIALPLLIRFFPENVKSTAALMLLAVLFAFAAATLAGKSQGFSVISSLSCFLIYILGGLSAILLIRDNAAYEGRFMYVLIFLGAWVTDAGAQLSGIAFGKHKLIPNVSPNKTVEGAVGGAVCGIAGYAVFALIIKLIYGVSINWFALIILGAVIVVVDQVGDLIASKVKREHGVKDFGKLFPGHGGALDRLDSIVSNAIVIFAYTALNLPIIFS